jgi:hypothetical protein
MTLQTVTLGRRGRFGDSGIGHGAVGGDAFAQSAARFANWNRGHDPVTPTIQLGLKGLDLAAM